MNSLPATRSETGTFRIRSRSANQSSTRLNKKLVDFISTILSHFTQHITSTFMWTPPVSLYTHIIRNFLTKRRVVAVLRPEMYGGEQTLRPAISWAAQPTSSAVVLYLQSSPDRKREWAQTRIWRSREGWTHTHIQKMYGRTDKTEFAPLTSCYYCCCRRHDHHQRLRLVGTQWMGKWETNT